MKKLYILALVALSFSVQAQTYFDQNFSTNTTVSTYVGTTANLFDAISPSAAPTSSNSTASINASNQLVFARNANAGIIAARSTDLTVPASGVYQMKFDFSGTRSAALVGGVQVSGQVNVALGTGFNSTDATGNGIPNGTATNAGDSYLNLRFNISNSTDNLYTISVMKSEDNNIGSYLVTSANISGSKTIRYIMNSKSDSIKYKNHLGDSVKLAPKKFDLYADGDLIFGGVDLTKSSVTPTDFKISFSSGNLRGIATFDNLLYNSEANFRTLATVLPVTLTSFKAKAEGNNIALNWTTASEQNSSHFDILSSVDGKFFSKIGTVKAAGNSNRVINYSLIDSNPFAGYNYYQLKQIDMDGTANFSEIIVTQSNLQKSSLVAYSTSLGVNLNIYADKASKSNIHLYSLSGQKISETNVSLNKGYNNFDINADLQPGVYIIKMLLNGNLLSNKFIKQ